MVGFLMFDLDILTLDVNHNALEQSAFWLFA